MKIQALFNENYRGADLSDVSVFFPFSKIENESYIYLSEPFLFLSKNHLICIGREAHLSLERMSVIVYESAIKINRHSLPILKEELEEMQSMIDFLHDKGITQTYLQKKFGLTLTQAKDAVRYGLIFRHKFRLILDNCQ